MIFKHIRTKYANVYGDGIVICITAAVVKWFRLLITISLHLSREWAKWLFSIFNMDTRSYWYGAIRGSEVDIASIWASVRGDLLKLSFVIDWHTAGRVEWWILGGKYKNSCQWQNMLQTKSFPSNDNYRNLSFTWHMSGAPFTYMY